MKTSNWFIAVSLVLASAACGRLSAAGPFQPSSVEIYFSPKGGATEACVSAIGAARKTIYIQAYSFTSAPIAKALVEAANRRVGVQVILDKSQRTEKYSSADFIAHAGIPTFIDAKHAIAHNKIMIIDGEVVITGSFNFTKAAEENNAENLLVIRDAKMAARYLANWQLHREHSTAYVGR
jgi:phosphatidylserine/phosphatidylglycerophosphate/cardiolipin synthase-like enzyme